MVRLLLTALVLGISSLFYIVAGPTPVSSDHNIFLPLVPGTPLMQQVIRQQEHDYCIDSRASAYPNFVSQLRDVNEQYAQRVGIKSREVSFSDTTCQVKHIMGQEFPCGDAAACIYYANWPVEIHYREQLGYVDWRSAQGHEYGHGLLGLHEMYRDSGGVIACTSRQDTVMDCGSGVRYPTSLDVGRGCSIIRTTWCGSPPAPPIHCEPYGGCYNGSIWFWEKTIPTLWTWDPNNHDFPFYGGWFCHEGCP